MPRMTGKTTLEGQLIDWSLEQPVPSPRLPVSLLDRSQKAAELQRLQRRKAMEAAYEAELILGLADDTPDRFDPPPGTPGAKKRGWTAENELPGVSEFFTAELSMVLNCGRGTAAHLAQRAWTFREKLPATWAALAAGELDERRARELADVLRHTPADVARAVEAQLLGEAASLSLRRLRGRAQELLLELDAAGTEERREEAKNAADVRVYPSPEEGMATLAADLPVDEAAACYELVDQLARMLKTDGDPRPIGAIRAAVVSLLIRRPADHALPDGVRIHLTVAASLASLTGTSEAPGEVNGQLITAAHLRELLARVGALGLQAPEGGSLAFALTDDDGALLATLTPDELARLARRGCRAHPDGECGCPVAGPPPPTGAYEPTDPQRSWVKTRDRTCRFPNCGQRVGFADLDHVIPHACGGETACENLCCLCRSHHRLKTFARGWRFVMGADGVLHVTTPSGITRTTHPPGVHPPAPPPAGYPAGEGPPGSPAGERRPPEPRDERPPRAPDDQPPPF